MVVVHIHSLSAGLENYFPTETIKSPFPLAAAWPVGFVSTNKRTHLTGPGNVRTGDRPGDIAVSENPLNAQRDVRAKLHHQVHSSVKSSWLDLPVRHCGLVWLEVGSVDPGRSSLTHCVLVVIVRDAAVSVTQFLEVVEARDHVVDIGSDSISWTAMSARIGETFNNFTTVENRFHCESNQMTPCANWRRSQNDCPYFGKARKR